MTEPLKPRIDFTGTLEQDPQEAFKTAQTFSGTQADNFSPALIEEPGVEEGPAEAVVEAALFDGKAPVLVLPAKGLGAHAVPRRIVLGMHQQAANAGDVGGLCGA